jgi:transcription elongation GreA/GreB family factor
MSRRHGGAGLSSAQRAQAALASGDWPAAARHLRAAARQALSQGDRAHAAQCEQMAASLLRALGSTEEARAAARRIARRDPHSGVARFASDVELAETAMEAGELASAVAAWQAATQEMHELNLPLWAQATVLRRLARALALAGWAEDAWFRFDQASSLCEGTDHERDVPWIDLEQARNAMEVGAFERTRTVLARVAVVRAAAADPHLSAECAMLQAELALAAGDAEAACRSARSARAAALEAVAPVCFLAACALLARAADQTGDRLEAYRVLATAWVTLGDLLGEPVAQSWVSPLLSLYRVAWGTAAFDAVKAGHDQRRRATLG